MSPEDAGWRIALNDLQPPADAGTDVTWVSPDGELTVVQLKRPLKKKKKKRKKKKKKKPRPSAWRSEFTRRLSVVGVLIVSSAGIGRLTGNQALTEAGISFGAPGIVALLYELALQMGLSKRSWPKLKTSVAAGSVRGLTGLAAFLAGREGPNLLGESAAHLRGESGHDPVTWAKVKEAARFVIAGACYRGQEWADAAWKPVDAVLRSRFLSGLFVAAPTIVDAFEVLTHKGTMTVLTSFSSIFGVGVALAAAVRYGRKRRGIELREPKPRQAGKDGQDS